jgi:hypothetical protein
MNETQLIVFNGVYISAISILYFLLFSPTFVTCIIFTILLVWGMVPTIMYFKPSFDVASIKNNFDAMSDIIIMLLMISLLLFLLFYNNYDSRVYVFNFMALALFLSIIDIYNVNLFSSILTVLLLIIALVQIGYAVSNRKIYKKYYDKPGINVFKRDIILSDFLIIFTCILAFLQAKVFDILPFRVISAFFVALSVGATGMTISRGSNLL